MKYKLQAILATGLFIALPAVFAQASNDDPMHIAGNYECKGYNGKDGQFTSQVTIVRDESASNVKNNFGAYTLNTKSTVGGGYAGFMAVQDDHAALYYQHNDSQKGDTAKDYGVRILTISHGKEGAAIVTRIFGSYYQPNYQQAAQDNKPAGGYGTWSCTQVK